MRDRQESRRSAPEEPALDEGSSARGPARWKGYTLIDFQVEAIEAVRAGKNVLVSAPTGAGKTLIAEYAIEDAVRRGRRCVYTAPIKALSNQKYRDFRDDPNIDVGLMTGDVTIHPTAQVLIMTTEILRNAIFEDPTKLADVEYVVFDEVHYMDDQERGSVWEESLIFAPKEMRFICLSATIANLEELGDWIREIRPHDLVTVRSTNRPVPLQHRMFTQASGIFAAERLNHVRAREPGGARERRHGRRERDRDKRRERTRGGDRDERRSFSVLLDTLQREELLPALVFAFSRKDCERLAYRNQRRKLLSEEEGERMRALQEELVRLFQLDADELSGVIFKLAANGLGYHHAGMLPIHKELVERMFTSGLLKMLFTTETFALGINMPARTVVFYSLRKFDGIQFDYLRTRDYMQMAGRAGRQGIDREGLVVSYLEERDLQEAPMERIVHGAVEPVRSRFRLAYSSILHLLERLGRERLHEAWEKSFNHFQHRESTDKARERNRREQRKLLELHLDLLQDLDYIEDDGQALSAKGRLARLLYGYELQITEMLFRGALENLPTAALAVVFVSLIYEDRRRGGGAYVSPRLFGGVRRHVDQMLSSLAAREAEFGIPTPMKLPDWGLSPAVVAWLEGASFVDLEEVTPVPAGDICRTFRMALQLVRQVRRAIDPSWDLYDRLEEVVVAMNRDEVDARRQLELG